jgi:hypothetical protein
LCRLTSIILNTEAPASAALVMKPARRIEAAAYRFALGERHVGTMPPSASDSYATGARSGMNTG